MANKILHAAQRKAFETALNTAMKKVDGNNNKGYIGGIDLIQKTLGKGWPDQAYENLREAFGKDGKWTQFFNNLNETTDLFRHCI